MRPMEDRQPRWYGFNGTELFTPLAVRQGRNMVLSVAKSGTLIDSHNTEGVSARSPASRPHPRLSSSSVAEGPARAQSPPLGRAFGRWALLHSQYKPAPEAERPFGGLSSTYIGLYVPQPSKARRAWAWASKPGRGHH